jgi:hypothetical protein
VRRGVVVSVVGWQPHVETSRRREVDQRDERCVISPDIDAEAATVHAAEESARELLVGYEGPRDPHGPPLLRSELDAFALETLNAKYRSKVRPPTFSVDTPPDIQASSVTCVGIRIVVTSRGCYRVSRARHPSNSATVAAAIPQLPYGMPIGPVGAPEIASESRQVGHTPL